jgi:hypothetical protein
MLAVTPLKRIHGKVVPVPATGVTTNTKSVYVVGMFEKVIEVVFEDIVCE